LIILIILWAEYKLWSSSLCSFLLCNITLIIVASKSSICSLFLSALVLKRHEIIVNSRRMIIRTVKQTNKHKTLNYHTFLKCRSLLNYVYKISS
jgi:hypothetical protein